MQPAEDSIVDHGEAEARQNDRYPDIAVFVPQPTKQHIARIGHPAIDKASVFWTLRPSGKRTGDWKCPQANEFAPTGLHGHFRERILRSGKTCVL
jgi:hypothetical protein